MDESFWFNRLIFLLLLCNDCFYFIFTSPIFFIYVTHNFAIFVTAVMLWINIFNKQFFSYVSALYITMLPTGWWFEFILWTISKTTTSAGKQPSGGLARIYMISFYLKEALLFYLFLHNVFLRFILSWIDCFCWCIELLVPFVGLYTLW